MSTKKSWGSTVIGWFVEREGDEPADAPAPDDQAQPQTAPGAVPARPVPPSPVELKGEVPLPAEAGAAIDFSSIFRAAGLGEEEQGRIDKALMLLQNLPQETPQEAKRQIVEASLQAFGYPTEQIIEAGVGEINALQAFIEFSQRDTEKISRETEAQIEALTQQIAEITAAREKKLQLHQSLTQKCNQHKLRVQEVLEFFGQETVARVVRESPKLHDPAATAQEPED